MIYQPEIRFPALVLCLVALAVMSGCGTSGGHWDQPNDDPVEVTRLSFDDEWTLTFRQILADVYGIDLKDMMGPFEYELDEFPVEEVEFFGPYFDEDVPEIPEEEYWGLIFQYSRSRFSGENLPGFGTYSLWLFVGINDDLYRVDKNVAMILGLYYGEGCKAGGESAREESTRLSESGVDIGLRVYLTPADSRVGLYLVMGLGWSSTSWSRTSTSEEGDFGGIIIHEDSGDILNNSAYAGLGTTLLRAKAFQLGVVATYGKRFFDQQEMNETEKELFGKSMGEYKLGVEVIVPF